MTDMRGKNRGAIRHFSDFGALAPVGTDRRAVREFLYGAPGGRALPKAGKKLPLISDF